MRTCTYNFDMRIDRDRNVYLMEIAPRDGGNYIPQLIRYATGVDLVRCSVQAAMGEPITPPAMDQGKGFLAYYAVHSLRDGVLKEIRIDPEVRSRILENHILAEPGDPVKAFTGANTTLGILLLRFDSMEQMLWHMDHGEQWIEVVLE